MYLKRLIKLLKKTLREQGNRPITGNVCEAYRPEFDIMIECDMPVKPKPSKWHNVEDKLPDTARAVLVYTADYNYPISAFLDTKLGKWHTLPNQTDIDHVMKWREMPKVK